MTVRRRKPADPARAWQRRLARWRPGLLPDVLEALATMYGRPVWRRRNEPTSELVLTILSQNTADINAERAFESLRVHYPPGSGEAAESARPADVPPPGWGGVGIRQGPPPDWSRVEAAPVPELVDVIRAGGLAPQKAPRIQSALRAIREETGGYSLDHLADLPATDALTWLTAIPGIGRKTASVVLLFCFGMPLMPVDRHVERVSKRIGLLPPRATAEQAHGLYLALLEPDQAYEAHVNLITHGRQTCHARRPACERCAVASRCRYVDRRAP